MVGPREKIQSLRVRNIDSKHFIPAESLNPILNNQVVNEVVMDCDVKQYRQSEVANLIVRGGRRTFAILIMIRRESLILRFVEKDELQGAWLDSKLPFSLPALKSILSDTDAIDFYDKQWEFVSPIFSPSKGHRELHDDTVLPFSGEPRRRGDGGFGFVAEIDVHPKHTTFAKANDNKVVIIRKELKETSPAGTDEFNREVDVLSFLNCLKHPNIVELLGSYTFKGRHYLLFPPAAGDLGQLFVGEEAPHYLQNDSDCLLALSGLASAIEKLHNYKSDALNVSLLGCHHDLKPKNVLVVEGRFLLADFGLSKFKDPSKDSKSPFGRGEGWYLAPECEDSENGFESGLIGRSSDVWSFGCIIAEVVTYMLLGAKGVQEFVKKRKVKLGGVLTTYTFHCGKTPNDGVDSWLRDLDALATPIGVNLNNLVRDLLQLEPAMRPSAMMVTSRLQELALSSRFGSVNEKYQIFAAKIGSLELLVERERFKLWGEAIGLTAVPPEQSTSLDAVRTDLTFSECINELKSIEADLTIKPQSPRTSILKLRMSNDNIFGKLPSSLLPAIERQLEQRMVETEDMSLLKEIKKTFDDSSRYRGIGTLAAIRYMHDLCTVPPINAGGALRLEGLTLQTLQQFPTFEIARLTQNGIARKGRVLIERIVYEEDWVGDLGEKMYNRVGAIAEFLSSTRDLAHLPVLECIGYYHEQKNHAFALLFDAPHFDDRRSKLFTLRSFIEDTYKTNSRPRLEDRLQLARLLAAALSEIHRVGWLHKNFSAYNVVLVSKGPAPPDSILEFPSLIGFNHSRPNGPDSISKKANTNTDELDYRHPQYLIDEERFRPEYDYFSLGMVLLEAGLWKPLRKITQAKAGRPPLSPSELVEDLLEKTVPLLDFYVGRKYRGVVEACLGGVPPSKASDHPKPATDKNLVLSQDTMFLADLWA